MIIKNKTKLFVSGLFFAFLRASPIQSEAANARKAERKAEIRAVSSGVTSSKNQLITSPVIQPLVIKPLSNVYR